MRKSKLKQISLAVCLAIFPLSNYAAGLGNLNIQSAIGEPLKAEVELLEVTPEDLYTLIPSIASEDDYAKQGITHLGIHNNIKLEVARSADGSYILKVQSNQPVDDPYLDLLIQLDWATGRLQRGYTVLLDPPNYKSELTASEPINLPSLDKSKDTFNSNRSNSVGETDSRDDAVEEKDQNPTKKTTSTPKVELNKQASAKTSNTGNQESDAQNLLTKSGDTLTTIAMQTQLEGVSLDQMLAGLYESNKKAFTDKNMNRLKVGQIIKVPSKDVVANISESEAKKIIKLHSVNWHAYRNGLAASVKVAPAKEGVSQKQSTAGKIAAAEDKDNIGKVVPKDVVKLSAGDKTDDKGIKINNHSAEAKVQALEEELTAREKSLKEANDKAAALEKQISDMQKLIAMKSQPMANIQKNAKATIENTKLANEKSKDVANLENLSAIEAKTAPAKIAEEKHALEAKPQEAKPQDAKPQDAKPQDAKSVDTPPKDQLTPAVKHEAKISIKPHAMIEKPTFIDSLFKSIDLMVLGGFGGIVLLCLGWVFLRNKRKKDLDRFESGISTSGGLRVNTVFGNTTGMSDTSFLTDLTKSSADGAMIHAHDVDPIAEAEVYMAYGRDAQAEEILKDAISKEPKRYELHLKLLELYVGRKDNSAFEALAGELYSTLGSSHPIWTKVVAMGSEIDPGNPLYNLDQRTSTTPLETQNLEDQGFSSPAVTSDSNVDSSINDDELVDNLSDENLANKNKLSDTINFQVSELDEKVEQEIKPDEKAGELANVSTPKTSAGKLNLNLPLKSMVSEVKNNTTTVPSSLKGVSFDLDLPVEEVDMSETEELTANAAEINFDLPSFEEPDIKKSDEVTKVEGIEVNAFGLPEVDVNLGATKSSLAAKSSTEEANIIQDSAESRHVDIKLDLAAAYIDMGDKEGARELLEEILKDGGSNQQAKARTLLDRLA